MVIPPGFLKTRQLISGGQDWYNSFKNIYRVAPFANKTKTILIQHYHHSIQLFPKKHLPFKQISCDLITGLPFLMDLIPSWS